MPPRSYNPVVPDDFENSFLPDDEGSRSRDHVNAVADKQVNIVYDPSQGSKDMSIRLELDAEEDWEGELETFCRLKRLGLIKEAKKYFWSSLGHLSTIPYIRVQYAEMLLFAGHYKEFRDLTFLPEFPPGPENETPDDRDRAKLAANYALLDLLSQRPIPQYLSGAWRTVRDTLWALVTESLIGSTEFQLLTLCLRVVRRLEWCTNHHTVGPAKVHAKCLFDWQQMYHGLDLFIAAVSVFGWENAANEFFGTIYIPKVVDKLFKDWIRPLYDESCVMGLLDLLTSLILQDHSDRMRTRNLLFLQNAKALADDVERNDPNLMMTRPFVQWLLAKSLLEMEAPSALPDGSHLQGPNILRLEQDSGINLPICVPSRRTAKPDWNSFLYQSGPAQKHAVEVVIRAADEIGDYSLRADAIKLLILQSEDPKSWFTALAKLQVDAQGDMDGYLATCLSGYLMPTAADQEADLLRNLVLSGSPADCSIVEQCENATLKWAWSMFRVLFSSAQDVNISPTARGEELSFLLNGFRLDNSTLPLYVREFAYTEFGVPLPESMHILSVYDPSPQDEDSQKDSSKQANPKLYPAPLPRVEPERRMQAKARGWTGQGRPPAVETRGPQPTIWLDPLAQGISPEVQASGRPSDDNLNATAPPPRPQSSIGQRNFESVQRGESSKTASSRKDRFSGMMGSDQKRRSGDEKRFPRKVDRDRSHDSYTWNEEVGSESPPVEKPQMSTEDGFTKLSFPESILNDHDVTVLVVDQNNPEEARVFKFQKDNPPETMASAKSRCMKRKATALKPPEELEFEPEEQELQPEATSAMFDVESEPSESTAKGPQSRKKTDDNVAPAPRDPIEPKFEPSTKPSGPDARRMPEEVEPLIPPKLSRPPTFVEDVDDEDGLVVPSITTDTRVKTTKHILSIEGHGKSSERIRYGEEHGIKLKPPKRTRDKHGNTLLHLATKRGRSEVVNLLLTYKHSNNPVSLDLNARNVDGETPLHLAIRHSHPGVVSRLLEHTNINDTVFLDVNARNTNRMTPLHLAAQQGDIHIVQLFLEHNDTNNTISFNGNARDKDGNTPLHLAAHRGHA
ncbi:hypothetical protein VTJ49DRAFT_6579 [Mycothermus thermophilus]|uniref:Ankyrin repeat protein n=1 Tax=Humicola insolens TaxID=85995 RepID=A0ABR3V159_HUMIN